MELIEWIKYIQRIQAHLINETNEVKVELNNWNIEHELVIVRVDFKGIKLWIKRFKNKLEVNKGLRK